jgi:hypothetical protein
VQNVISMVKWKLNQEEQSEVYLTILETLAVNYVEVRGQMSLTWLNLPVDSIKAENKNEVELSRGKIGGVEDRPRQMQWRRNKTVPPDATIDYAMDQMGAPRQPDESSEMYARCQAAVQCIHKTLLRGDVATEASETISRITSIYPPPQHILLLNEWNDCISYQRLREDDLCWNGKS